MSSGDGMNLPTMLFMMGPLGSTIGQIAIANQQADIQKEQIRQQQVQLRLQDNQQAIARLKNLESIVATQQVQLGARGISPSSGTVRAIFNTDYANYEEDKNAARLNFLAKNETLTLQKKSVGLERDSRVISALSNFGKDVASMAMSAYGMPSPSLVNTTTPPGGSNFNLNR